MFLWDIQCIWCITKSDKGNRNKGENNKSSNELIKKIEALYEWEQMIEDAKNMLSN